jgi:mannosylglycerate hydrolase
VRVVDEILSVLSREPDFPFLLDGQGAALRDYLAVRPEQAELVERAMARRQLEAGPWLILMDEFLCSGEAIIRNLEMGIREVSRYGPPLMVGYLPDMFGHASQMPQVLRLFGIEKAVVWRGVPAEVDSSWFDWVAPDGSRVRCAYLYNGYSNGANLSNDPETSYRILQQELRQSERFACTDRDVLVMVGTDHQPVKPWLLELARTLQAAHGDEMEVRVARLSDYLAEADPGGDVKSWQGELRSSARANLLMGVASNRVDAKLACHEATFWLERLAEPLSALVCRNPDSQRGLLVEAWRKLVENSAHDSACACSIDPVVEQVKVRYREAVDIARGLVEWNKEELAKHLPRGNAYFLSLSQWELPVLAESFDVEASPGITQALGDASPVGNPVMDVTIDKATVEAMLSQLNSATISEGVHVVRVTVGDPAEDPLVVDISTSHKSNPTFSLAQAKLSVAEAIRVNPAGKVRVRIAPSTTGAHLYYAGSVPAFSFLRASAPQTPPAPLDCSVSDSGDVRVKAPNVDLLVESATGRIVFNGLEGFCRLVDEGDAGDTYNYSPPARDIAVDTPSKASVSILERGPLRARVSVSRLYEVPEQLSPDAGTREGACLLETETIIEARATDPLVRLRIRVNNPAKDHRLRAVFPLPSPASHSLADGPFSLDRRGLTAEGGPTERGLATYPSWSFVQAGGLTIIHKGLHEYELIDLRGEKGTEQAHSLAITLLRCVGWLSRSSMRYRPTPAGPSLPTPGAQMIGEHILELAVTTAHDNPFRLRDLFYEPILLLEGTSDAAGEPGPLIEIKGDAVVSAIRRNQGFLEVRLFNPWEHDVSLSFPRARGGYVVSPLGEVQGELSGELVLAPFRIVTLWLRDGQQ